MSSMAARIKRDLEHKIRAGEWTPGARIPTEHELTARYGCARMTVHAAIASLVAKGLIERRKKAGSFVARPHVQTAVIEIPDIRALIEARGETYRFELLGRRRLAAATLGIGHAQADFAPAGPVLAVDGLHVADDRPFCIEYRIISLAAAPAAEHADFSATAPGSWLLEHIPWSQARHRVTACAAGAAAGALRIAKTSACLSVERWTWRLGAPVTFVRQIFPGDRYDLTAQFSPHAAGGA